MGITFDRRCKTCDCWIPGVPGVCDVLDEAVFPEDGKDCDSYDSPEKRYMGFISKRSKGERLR
jgi:hypothetical protein